MAQITGFQVTFKCLLDDREARIEELLTVEVLEDEGVDHVGLPYFQTQLRQQLEPIPILAQSAIGLYPPTTEHCPQVTPLGIYLPDSHEEQGNALDRHTLSLVYLDVQHELLDYLRHRQYGHSLILVRLEAVVGHHEFREILVHDAGLDVLTLLYHEGVPEELPVFSFLEALSGGRIDLVQQIHLVHADGLLLECNGLKELCLH